VSGGGGGSIVNETPRALGVRLQKSSYGVPISLVWGRVRIAPNIFWQNNFQAIEHRETQNAGGGGKGGGGDTSFTNVTYTYTTGIAMGLCEGPLSSALTLWIGKAKYGGYNAPILVETAETKTVDGAGQVTVDHAANFYADRGVQLAATSSGGGWAARLAKLVIGATDVPHTVSAGVYQFASSMIGAIVTVSYAWQNGTTASDGLASRGFSFFDGSYAQSAWSYLTSAFPGQDLAERGQAYIAASAFDLGSSPELPNISVEVQSQNSFGGPNSVPDVALDVVATDALTSAKYGAGFPLAKVGSLTQFRNFTAASGIFAGLEVAEQREARELLAELCQMGVSAPFFSEALLKIVPYGDAAVTGNGVTYTPDNASKFDPGWDDILPPGAGRDEVSAEDAILVRRKTPADLFNQVQVEFLNRALDHNIDIAEAKDQAMIDLYGLRPAPVVKLYGLRTAAAARAVAQLLLQRALYIPNEYEFVLGWRYCLLEPMDIGTIPDPVVDGARLPVRIREITENDEGQFTILAEDFPAGVGSNASYASQAGAGGAVDLNADPGVANMPVFVEAPYQLSRSDGPELWLALSGGAAFGGAEVHLSTDGGSSYVYAGRAMGNARTGRAALAYAASGDPDTAGTLRVDLAESGGQLAGVTHAEADAGFTLCALNGELIAYGDAALVSGNTYDLSYIRRARYGSPTGAHGVGARFARLDGAIFRWAYPAELIGTEIFVKVCPFNKFGSAVKALSEVPSYAYTLSGPYVLPMYNVSGLELFGQASGNTFTGRDAKATWRAQSLTQSYEMGDEPAGAGAGALDRFFSHYEVSMKKTDGTLLRTERVLDPLYTYTFEKNREDNAGTPLRSFRFEVVAVSKFGTRSPIPALLEVSNPAPVLADGMTLSGGGGAFGFSYTKPTDSDFAGVKVYASLTSGFTPDASTLAYSGSKNPGIVGPLNGGMNYYVVYVPYDDFGDGAPAAEQSVLTLRALNQLSGAPDGTGSIAAFDTIAAAACAPGKTLVSGAFYGPVYAPTTGLVYTMARCTDNTVFFTAWDLTKQLGASSFVVKTAQIAGQGAAPVFANGVYAPSTGLIYWSNFTTGKILALDPATLTLSASYDTPGNVGYAYGVYVPTTGKICWIRQAAAVIFNPALGTFGTEAAPASATFNDAAYVAAADNIAITDSGNGKVKFYATDLSASTDYTMPIGSGPITLCYAGLNGRTYVKATSGTPANRIITVLDKNAALVTTIASSTVQGAMFYCPLNQLVYHIALTSTSKNETFSPITNELLASLAAVDGLRRPAWVPYVNCIAMVDQTGTLNITRFFV
jgi:hypothetical protein